MVLSVKELAGQKSSQGYSPDRSGKLVDKRLKVDKKLGSRSSSFNRAFDRKSKRIGTLVDKIRRDGREERLFSLGIHPSQRKLPVIDYGPGYREYYPRGYYNEDNYISESDSENTRKKKKSKGLLPLRSELNYKKRQGRGGPVFSVHDYSRIQVKDRSGKIVFKKRRKQYNRGTNTGMDDCLSNADNSMMSYTGGHRSKKLAKKNNNIVRGIYYTAADPLKPRGINVSTSHAFKRRAGRETSGDQRQLLSTTEYSAAHYDGIEDVGNGPNYLSRLGGLSPNIIRGSSQGASGLASARHLQNKQQQK